MKADSLPMIAVSGAVDGLIIDLDEEDPSISVPKQAYGESTMYSPKISSSLAMKCK